MFESKTEMTFGEARQVLICLEDEESVGLLANSFSEMGFSPKGCSVERDIVIAMRNENYDVIVLPEYFAGGTIADNTVLRELTGMNSADRRHQYCIVVSKKLSSVDQMAAFRLSVDLVINRSDIADSRELIERGLSQKQRALFAFIEMQQVVGTE